MSKAQELIEKVINEGSDYYDDEPETEMDIEELSDMWDGDIISSSSRKKVISFLSSSESSGFAKELQDMGMKVTTRGNIVTVLT